MLAMNAAPGIATRHSGSRGLTAQTRSAAMPTAISGNCQTEAATVGFSVSPRYNAYAISPSAGSESQGALLIMRCHQGSAEIFRSQPERLRTRADRAGSRLDN